MESPVQTIGSLMQMRGQVAEVAYKQAQAEQARQNALDIKAQADQRNRDLADQNTIQEMLKDPSAAPLLAKGDTSPLNGKVSPVNQQKFAENQLGVIAKHATVDTSTLENRSKALDLLTKGLASFRVNPDLDTTNSQLPGFIQQHIKDGTFQMAGIDPSQLQQQFSSLDQLDHAEAGLGLLKGVTDAALATKKEQAGITETTAKGNQAQADADMKAFELDLMKKNVAGGQGQGYESSVAGLIDKTKYPDAYTHALAAANNAASGADVRVPGAANKAAAEAVKDIYEKEVMPYLPSTVKGKADSAAAIANAEIPSRVSAAVAVEKAKIPLEMSMRQQTAGATEYEKSLASLSSAAADASRIHNLIQAAQSGNKAAPGLIPLAELRQYVNRVNQSELRNVQGAGSLADKVEGWVTGHTEGQPIPPDILQATDQLASLQLQNAEQKHVGEVSAVNTARGTSFKAKKAADLGFSPIGSGNSAGGGVPTPKSQAEYNAIPKGGKFMKPNDSKVYIKQ